jgi:hypothetical protein
MNDIEQILQDLGGRTQKAKMSPAEKNHYRNKLMQFMEKADAAAGLKPSLATFSEIFRSFFRKMNPAFLAAPLALAIGTGVVFAAQSALPGNPLYGLKINVIEQVQTGLAVSNYQKAKLDIVFVDRRLLEAEALAEQNKLTGELKHELYLHFEEKSAELMKEIDSLKNDHDDAAVTELNSSFDQTLQLHDKIIGVLREDFRTRVEGEASKNTPATIIKEPAQELDADNRKTQLQEEPAVLSPLPQIETEEE